jgi:hypothetical protein
VVCNLFIEYIAPSTNAMYAGQHWRDRVKHKSLAMQAVIARVMAPGCAVERFTEPVDIEILPHLGKGRRAYDVSNYSYTYKLIEDCLVERKILLADTSNFVKSVKFLSPIRCDRTGVMITIKKTITA